MNPVSIIYENSEIIIINKPQGVAVQGGQNIAHPLDRELPQQLGYPVYLVHRLDQETQGLLVVAKTPHAGADFQCGEALGAGQFVSSGAGDA